MYELDEMNEVWRSYFEELDPQERLKLLNALEDQKCEDLDFCRMLYRERYTDPKNPSRKVDTWLWKFVYLPGLYKRQKFLKSALRKEMQGTLKELHLEQPEMLSERKKDILYFEFRNAARRYLSTCRGSHYARKFFGLKSATDQEKLYKVCEDIWSISKGLATITDLEENLRLWCDALYDELLAFDPESQKYYAELELKSKK